MQTGENKQSPIASGLIGAACAPAIAEIFVFTIGWRGCGSPGWGLNYMLLTLYLLLLPALLVAVVGFCVGFFFPMRRKNALLLIAACCIAVIILALVLAHPTATACRIDL